MYDRGEKCIVHFNTCQEHNQQTSSYGKRDFDKKNYDVFILYMISLIKTKVISLYVVINNKKIK